MHPRFLTIENQNEKKILNAMIEYYLYDTIYEMEFSAAEHFQTASPIIQFIFHFTMHL